jgi:hypothetical protein
MKNKLGTTEPMTNEEFQTFVVKALRILQIENDQLLSKIVKLEEQLHQQAEEFKMRLLGIHFDDDRIIVRNARGQLVLIDPPYPPDEEENDATD